MSTKTTRSPKVRLGIFINPPDHQQGFTRFRYNVVTIGRNVWEQNYCDQHPTDDSYKDIHPDTIRNCCDDLINGFYLGSLQLYASGSTDYPTRPRMLSGFSVEYRDLYKVTRREAERMAHTLRSIENHMTKTAEKYGRPQTFGQFCGHAAHAIKADSFVMTEGISAGWYDKDSHRFLTIADGIWQIDRQIQLWIDAGKPQPEQASA